MLRAWVSQLRPIPAEIVDDIARDFSLDEVEHFAQVHPQEGPSGNGHRNGRKRRAPKSHGSRPAVESRLIESGHEPPAGVTQVRLPLFVYGYGPDGNPFYEDACTIAMSARGGLISMNTLVTPGQRLILTNKENECSQECVVEFLGARLARGVDVGFEFPAPTPDFWGIQQTDKDPISESEKACA